MATKETITGTRVFGERLAQCQINFADQVAKVLGADRAAGLKVFEVYRKAKVLKIDTCNVTYTVKHGAFWNIEVLRRALAS